LTMNHDEESPCRASAGRIRRTARQSSGDQMQERAERTNAIAHVALAPAPPGPVIMEKPSRQESPQLVRRETTLWCRAGHGAWVMRPLRTTRRAPSPLVRRLRSFGERGRGSSRGSVPPTPAHDCHRCRPGGRRSSALHPRQPPGRDHADCGRPCARPPSGCASVMITVWQPRRDAIPRTNGLDLVAPTRRRGR